MRSLFWLMILLFLILYIFSIFFTQGVSDYLMDNADALDRSTDLRSQPDKTCSTTTDLLEWHYGSLYLSALTLFISITGGVSWNEVMHPLTEAGKFFVVMFLVYIFFCTFSVLNIV